jgi:hypothetical protein
VEFAAWVAGLKARFGTMQAVADRVGMSLSAFTRGVVRGTLGVENLLELARVADEHPSKVLRLAGKTRVAELIENAYGPGLAALTASQRELLEEWASLPPDVQAASLQLMRAGNARRRRDSAGTSVTRDAPQAATAPVARRRRQSA